MPKQPTPDEIETTARTLQKLRNNYDGRFDENEALQRLFNYMIGTFGKLYNEEEELDVLIDNIESFQHDDKHEMFDDLVHAEDIEAKRKKETENTVLVEKIRNLLR